MKNQETQIEAFTRRFMDSLGYPWTNLMAQEKESAIEAATSAISEMPDAFSFKVPGNGLRAQGLTDVRQSLLDEQRYADAERGKATANGN